MVHIPRLSLMRVSHLRCSMRRLTLFRPLWAGLTCATPPALDLCGYAICDINLWFLADRSSFTIIL